ncbi:MAG: UTP--glucose-1-phosphate uridylyltransferase [Parvibaculales bacterium]
MSKPVKKVVFPVAGMGTRFLPATKAVPKEMLPVVDKPLIQWAVEEAAAAGITEFIFVSAPEKKAIMEHFGHNQKYTDLLEQRGKTKELALLQAGLPDQATVHEVFQPEPLGLGHAIWCAKELVGDDPFAVILPDDMVKHPKTCLQQMVESYAETGGNLVAVEEVPREETYRYGVLDPDPDFQDDRLVRINGLVEKPAPEDAPSNLAIIGRYVFDPAIMRQLDTPRIGAGGEIQITDAMADLIGRVALHGFRFDGTRYDCGNKAGFLAANIAYAMDDSTLAAEIRTTVETLTET